MISIFFPKGGKIDTKVTKKVLGDMGIELTNREVNALMKRLPIAGRYSGLQNGSLSLYEPQCETSQKLTPLLPYNTKLSSCNWNDIMSGI